MASASAATVSMNSHIDRFNQITKSHFGVKDVNVNVVVSCIFSIIQITFLAVLEVNVVLPRGVLCPHIP